MKLTEIQDLIKFVAKSGVTEVEIEQENFKIIIKSESGKKRNKQQDGGAEAYIQAPMPMAMPAMPQMPQQMQPQQPQPAQPAAAPAAEAPAKKEEAASSNNYITIKSPMIGTFYRSPGPDKDTFVNVGDDVKPGKIICIIEAMKLFNEIESEVTGKIVKVLVDDASPVEYDQPLFLVDPAK